MTDFDLREITKRRALESLVERCIESEECLWSCLLTLTPDYFAFDYDLRIAFYALVGRLGTDRYDPALNRDYLVRGFAALDLQDDPAGGVGAAFAAYRHYWELTFDDWYDPCTVVSTYVWAVLFALVEMNEIEAATAAVLRDNFANAPLAVDQALDDAVWDRIRGAVLGRRALRYSKVVPPLPQARDNAADWEGIKARAYA